MEFLFTTLLLLCCLLTIVLAHRSNERYRAAAIKYKVNIDELRSSCWYLLYTYDTNPHQYDPKIRFRLELLRNGYKKVCLNLEGEDSIWFLGLGASYGLSNGPHKVCPPLFEDHDGGLESEDNNQKA